MGWLLGLINPISKIVGALERAYAVKADAETDQQKIAADERIAELKEQHATLRDKQRSPVFWTIWALFAGVTAAYYAKIVVVDVMLGWGTTDALKGQAALWAQSVVDSIFITGGGVAAVGVVANAWARRRR